MIQDEIINEIWRAISGYENYQVSNIGRVRNTDTGKMLKPRARSNNYYIVDLSKDGVKKTHQVHQLVAEEFLNKAEIEYALIVDHIDCNKLNNQISNLRYVTKSQNMTNSVKQLNTSSRFKGVHWHNIKSEWHANIQLANKHIYLGSYKYEIDAARAYNTKAIELFREYACLNQVDDP